MRTIVQVGEVRVQLEERARLMPELGNLRQDYLMRRVGELHGESRIQPGGEQRPEVGIRYASLSFICDMAGGIRAYAGLSILSVKDGVSR